MSLDLPDVLSASDVSAWSDEVDVVVVGFGISGGCAALEAARAGARVVLLERAAEYGGTSAMAGGHFYLGGGTAVQRAVGVEDSPEELCKYLMAVTRETDDDTAAKIRAFSGDSVEHFDWIESLGMRFERSFYPEKAVIQPGTQGLMYTGNEKVWPFLEKATPAPRGHKVPQPGDTDGAKIVLDALAARIAETSVDVRYETGATNLVVDGDRVVGIAWRHFEERGVIRAGAVVIAAGGYVGNDDMVREYTPQLGSKLIPLASTYDDGLGIRLGASVGADLRMMDQAFITAPFYPPSKLVTGIVVNKDGKRFVAEDSYHSRTAGFVMDQPDRAAFLIVDSAHIEHPDFPLCPFIDGWETVEEMEAALGIPEGNLVATLGDYNKHAADKQDPDLHKHPDWLEPQDRGPWGAYDLSLGKALYAGFTMGGMRVDLDGRVQRADLSVIDGLYAAGACAVNIAQDGKGYASGTQLAEGSYFGRRTGRRAAGR
ncbi:FAD-binding protein [Nocardioides terrisoli]|uniref:FAD-binding protein n=1 Tax=Nocardioides terrisoli TaxID=3388267 RepID=UPI00287BC970|nr:FAD-binding protein [Nocardioides marmorisolisilvae]